jgi:hypothetical protein
MFGNFRLGSIQILYQTEHIKPEKLGVWGDEFIADETGMLSKVRLGYVRLGYVRLGYGRLG